jgi:flavin-dependent dehydrogenase
MVAHEDERTRALDEILRMSSVPIETRLPGGGHAAAHLFVLGCLERRVTIFAQQIRALNLITALEERGGFIGGLARKRVAVVGVGVAGATAALAAEARGAVVTAYERNTAPFQNLSRSQTRWLHPRIYDWPNPGWTDDVADLPHLAWTADLSAKVARRFVDEWNTAIDRNQVAFHRGKRCTRIVNDGGLHSLVVDDEPHGPFDIVILALGFGAERQLDGHSTPSYWADFSIEGDKILVVGCGDGGLIDAIRASSENFVQEYLHTMTFDRHEELEKAVSDIEFDLVQNRISAGELPERYRGLPHRKLLDDILRQGRRLDTQVHVAAQEPGMMNANASPLHRVIASRLVDLGALTHVRARVTAVVRRGDRDAVTFEDGGKTHEDEFAMVIARLGPESALAAFSREIHDAVARKFPALGAHRLPPPLWQRPAPQPVSRHGTADGVAGHPAHHPFDALPSDPIAGGVLRQTTIGKDGIADVVVELTDVRTNGPLLLAAPRGTIGNIDWDDDAVVDGHDAVPVSTQQGVDGVGVRFEIRTTRAAFHRIRWTYRLTNGVAMNCAETEMFHARAWRSSTLGRGWEILAHHLQLKTRKLILELVYPEPAFFDEVVPNVDRPSFVNGELTWEPVGEEEARCALAKGANTLRLVVDNPVQHFRYGIKYRLSSAGTAIDDGTLNLLSDTIRHLRGTQREGEAPRGRLAMLFRSVVALHARCQDHDLNREDLRIAVMLWDAEAKLLVPVGGLFQPSSWGSVFHYGVGVAGHAFRFRCPVAWFRGSRDRSSVIRTAPRSGHPAHDWILCFPLFATFPDEAMGVVSIAGNDAAPWYRLRDLARSSTREDVLKINLQMMYDLNAALWELLASTWDSDAVRESRARHEQSWPRKP